MIETTPRTIAADHDHAPIDWAAALAEADGWLRVAVRARVGEWQAVEEVMQEVALAAVAQKAPLSDPAKAPAWLYRLAVRQTLLYRRRCGRRRKLVGRYTQRAVAEGGRAADPLDWLLRDERRGLVRQALDRLSGRDAEILLLKYSENWSYRELAEHLGIAVAAVEARLHRARLRLRNELADRDLIEVRE